MSTNWVININPLNSDNVDAQYPILLMDMLTKRINVRYFDSIDEINNLRQPAVYYWPLIHMPLFWIRQLYILFFNNIFIDFANAENSIRVEKYREIKDMLIAYDEKSYQNLWHDTNDFYFDFSKLLMSILRDPRKEPLKTTKVGAGGGLKKRSLVS